MTIFKLMGADLEGAALGRQEDSRVNSAKARLSKESTTGGCAPCDFAKARPVALSPTCPLREGDLGIVSSVKSPDGTGTT